MYGRRSVQEGFGGGKGINLADVNHAETGGFDTENRGINAGIEIEIDDGEAFGPCSHSLNQTWRKDVDAREGKKPTSISPPQGESSRTADRTFHFAGLDVFPTDKAMGIVEDKIAGGVAMADKQKGLLTAPSQEGVVELCEVGIVEDVDVVDEDRLGEVEEVGCMTDGTTRVKKFSTFITNQQFQLFVLCTLYFVLCTLYFVPCTLYLVHLHEVDNLVSKMVDVDDDACEASRGKMFYLVLQQWLSTYGHEGFRHRVSEGLESCAEAGSEDECLFHFKTC